MKGRQSRKGLAPCLTNAGNVFRIPLCAGMAVHISVMPKRKRFALRRFFSMPAVPAGIPERQQGFSISKEETMSTAYEPKAIEKKWQDIWQGEKAFAATEDYTKPK